MILGDAVVEWASVGEGRDSPLRELRPSRATVEEIVRAVDEQPHLRRSYPRPEDVLLELLALDSAGALRLAPRALGAALRSHYEGKGTITDRSLAYVATYEKNWSCYRDLYDFVEVADANAARKAFQRDVYLERLGAHLARLGGGAAVLDAGCGVGRLTAALLQRGYHLTCADASAEALKCAVRVGLHGGATAETFDARLCDVRDLSCFPDGIFAATLSLEVICYQEHPSVSLGELVRVTAPGGLVAVSVEGLHGSCIADPKIDAGLLQGVLDTGALDIEDEISVRYFTKAGLYALLEGAGLEAVEVIGTHYTADGVFDRLVTDDALADPGRLRDLAALERAAADDATLEPLARAWLATARVPGEGR